MTKGFGNSTRLLDIGRGRAPVVEPADGIPERTGGAADWARWAGHAVETGR